MNFGFTIPQNFLSDSPALFPGYSDHLAQVIVPDNSVTEDSEGSRTEFQSFSLSNRSSVGNNPINSQYKVLFSARSSEEAYYIIGFFKANKGSVPFNFTIPYTVSYDIIGGNTSQADNTRIFSTSFTDIYEGATLQSLTDTFSFAENSIISSTINDTSFFISPNQSVPDLNPIKVTNIKKDVLVVCESWNVSTKYLDSVDISATFERVYPANKTYTPQGN